MLFREHVLSDVLPHLHNKNDNTHSLFFTSSQNSTFSLKGLGNFASDSKKILDLAHAAIINMIF